MLCDGNVWETLQLPWLFEAWIWKELSHTDPEGETSLPGQGTALTWRAMAAEQLWEGGGFQKERQDIGEKTRETRMAKW